jgi:protein TonB
MVREPKTSPIIDGPLMELDYIQVETTTPEPEKKIEPVKPRQKVVEEEKEVIPEQITDALPVVDIPLEQSAVPQPEISTSTAQMQHSTGTVSVPELTTLNSVTELDNTDFDPIYNPKPDYPAVALNAHISGFVDVNLIINEQGKVESFSIVETKGHPSFAVETARVLPRWKFPPPRIGGKRVRVQYRYRVNFTLN